MPSTTRQSIRYPASSDAPNGPQQMLNLASDVDARPTWRGVGSAYPGNIAVGDTFYHLTMRCTMRAMTTGGSWKQDDIVFVTDDTDRLSFLASVSAAGLTLHEGFLVWQDDTDELWGSTGSNSLVSISGRPRVQYVASTALDGSSVAANASIRQLRRSAVVNVSNTSGGFTVNYGITFTKLISVSITPGDTSGPMGFIVPVAANHTLTAANGVAYQPGGGVVPNGTAIRVELDVVGL